MKNKCYRIVTDMFLGFEVQLKKSSIFFSDRWEQCHKNGASNTFSSIERAKEWIDAGCPKDEKKPERIVVEEYCP